jgi:hypothetical protein
MHYGDELKQTLAEFCRSLYAHDSFELGIITEFQNDYDKRTPLTLPFGRTLVNASLTIYLFEHFVHTMLMS